MQASRQLSLVTLVLVVVLPVTVCRAQSDPVQDAKQPYSSAMAIASRPASDQQFAERNSRESTACDPLNATHHSVAT